MERVLFYSTKQVDGIIYFCIIMSTSHRTNFFIFFSRTKSVLEVLNPRRKGKTAKLLTRLAVLEARGAKRATIWTVLYISAVYLAFGIALGMSSCTLTSLPPNSQSNRTIKCKTLSFVTNF